MKKHCFASLAACLALAATSARGQITVAYAKPFHAQRPAGVVLDPSGAAIPGTKIESCHPHWDDCVAAAITDDNGKFILGSVQRQKRYYLKLTCYGFDPLKLELQLRRFARKELTITMKVAT